MDERRYRASERFTRGLLARKSAPARNACKAWTEHEDNALLDILQAEGARVSDWDDKSKRFQGGGARSGLALRKRWSILKRKNKDIVGSARKKSRTDT